MNNDNQHRWLDGSLVASTYDNWYPGEPTNGVQNYIDMSASLHVWTDYTDRSYRYICEAGLIQTSQPWFCDYLRDLKREKRSMEKKWRKSDSEEDKKAFRKARNTFVNTTEQKRVEHISNEVSNCDGDQG